uniref:Si:dkey-32e6.3 n=1 Tax=Nothobranchius kuhntae TaxID=321403 RepID=A0A1A8HP44_NOTKU
MAEERNGAENGGVTGTDEDYGPVVSVPAGIGFLNHVRKKRLVIHIDLNNTILVSDAVTGQGTVAALEYFLTSVTWGKKNDHGKWEWLSDAPSLHPPSSDAVSYYSQFGRVPGFTSVAGRRFKGVLDEHLEQLRWPEGIKGDKELSVRGEDGRLYHWILPSFFQLLRDLTQEEWEFSILFRTFGTDLPRVLRAVSRAVNEGAHPLFPDLPELKLSLNLTPGKIRCSKRAIVVSRAEERASSLDGDRGLYQYFSAVHGLGGFQDHFDWWASNSFSLRGGKPVWIDPFDQQVQHIFIDDNIRVNDEDTIVHPKVFLDPGGSDTRTASTFELYDITLVQTDLLRAISDPSYFTQRVHICLENYERNVQHGVM